MDIAIIGIGAVGGYFGARLAQAGHRVSLLARGATAQALRTQGLRVRSPLGDVAVQPPVFDVFEDPAAVGPVELTLVAVKAHQVAALAPTLAPLCAGGGAVLPLQNGVAAPELLGQALGADRVLGGLCRIIAWAEAPGVIVHGGANPEITLGEFQGGGESPRLSRCAAALAVPGISVRVAPDIRAALWEKLAFIAAFGALGAASRAPVGALRAVPESRRLLEAAIAEVAAVAAGEGVALAVDLPQRTLAYLDTLPPGGTSSLQRDIAAGRPSELEALVGDVVRRGAAVDAPTPVFGVLYGCLRAATATATLTPSA